MTGSFIAGTPEDAALPVDVIGADEIQRQGNPTTIELMKKITVSGAVVGDSNPSGVPAPAPSGVATINLRGLGSERTLVLLNGRRLANFPVRGGPVDINSLPQIAMSRIEILKDGAAATYGSDAIGGVVNFITRKNFEGLQMSGSVRVVPDAEDPDYNLGVLWGWVGDRGNVMLSAGWQTRGRLRFSEREFNDVPYTVNPEAYGSNLNPGAFSPVVGATVGATMRDPGCTTVGATAGFAGTTPACFPRMLGFYGNFVDPTVQWQIYGETNFDLADNLKFHAEALYTETQAASQTPPASSSALGGPTSASSPVAPNYLVPATNPGLALLIQQFPNAFPAGTTGVVFAPSALRIIGRGGSPMFDNGHQQTQTFKTYRVSAGFSGTVADSVNWDLSGTYHVVDWNQRGIDELVYRQALALRGYGSQAADPRCTSSVTNNYTTNAGNNAVGCYYFNPFSNNFAVDTFTGKANPLFNASAANNLEVFKWISQFYNIHGSSRLFVVDGVLNGKAPLEFAGGQVGWAAGVQFRRNFYRTDANTLFDLNVSPCVDSPFTGSTSCVPALGPFATATGIRPSNVVQNAYSLFAEISLPFTDTLQAHIAARYEDYGADAGGDTFNPKLDVRWQALDWLALRGSIGTTFRAPPLTLLDPSSQGQVFVITGSSRGVNVAGNRNLKPETATTYSVGAIAEAGPFKASVDYWNFDFADLIRQEPFLNFFNAMFPNNSAVNCGNPAFAEIQARFTFEGGVCGASNIRTINTTFVNAGSIKIDGVDVDAQLSLGQVLDGSLKIGGQLSWLHKFQVSEQRALGLLLAAPFDAAGQGNFGSGFSPMPKIKWNLYAEWDRGPHNLRIQSSFMDGYLDERTAPFTGNLLVGDVATVAQATVVPRPQGGKNVDTFFTTDITYCVFLPSEVTAVFNVSNIFNEDPPRFRQANNYEPYLASALGRNYKVAIIKKF
ncbi:MAG: TonB-dependent receptor [Hyphomonadaceae bacterium]|nr:TonB-dependent receptor [Hyphomonadaceae bacterium]